MESKVTCTGHLDSFLGEDNICQAMGGLNLDNNTKKIDNNELKMFTVVTGKNGVGKTQLLKYIQSIVNHKNKCFPFFIVRTLTYGEDSDNYEPENHPFVRNLDDYLGSSYEKWEKIFQSFKIKDKNKNPSLNKYFFNYYYRIILEEERKKIKEIYEKSEKKVNRQILYDKFKEYLKKQVLKKFCYGNLEQMLELNMGYQKEIDEINQFLSDNEYGLKFPYSIVISEINKSNIKDYVLFNSCNKTGLKLMDLSPGERLVLHFLLILKEKENIILDSEFSNTKQILLLDEPDCHCEQALIKSILDIIQNDIIDKLNIQVIMTTHNITTIKLLGLNPGINNNCIFTLSKNHENKVELMKDSKKSIRIL